MKGKVIISLVTNDLSQDQRMCRICDTLQNAGFEVTLVGFRREISTALPPTSFLRKRLSIPFRKGKWFYMTANIRLFLFLLFRRVDIINPVDYDTLLPAVLVGRLRRKKIIFDAHEWFEEVPELRGRLVTKKIWETIARWCIPRTDARYTVSDPIAHAIGQKYQADFQVIHNYPKPVAHINREKKERNIIYVGMFNEGRGLDSMIKVMPLLDAQLLLIGRGDIEHDLRKLVKELDVEDKVKFMGFQDRPRVEELLSTGYIGINLLEDRSLNYRYSLANKFFDYVQFGMPQITMQFPTYTALNKKHQVAVLLDNLEISTLAAAANDLLEDQEHWDKMFAATFRAKLDWNWTKEASRLLSIFEKVISK